jgi:hypothetical protein
MRLETDAIPQAVWADHRPWLESPKAVAAELGITTAECLARARGETQPRDYSLFTVNEGPVVWIYRPARRAQMERTTSLREGSRNAC